MKVGIIGLGLIGGSMALALRKAGLANTVIGVDANSNNTKRAQQLGIIDCAGSVEDLVDTDLIVVAIPVNAITQVVAHVLDLISKHALVVDMGSTKEGICNAIKAHDKRGRYVASHPIAGTENSGPDSAFETLFENKLMIICDTELSDADALEQIKKIYTDIGMRVVEMSSNSHDKHMAYVSHLSHVSSYMLSATVLDIEKDENRIFDLAGSGFASTARLAKSTPSMWGPIFTQNSEHITQALSAYIHHLTELKILIENKDLEGIDSRLKHANRIRKVLNK